MQWYNKQCNKNKASVQLVTGNVYLQVSYPGLVFLWFLFQWGDSVLGFLNVSEDKEKGKIWGSAGCSHFGRANQTYSGTVFNRGPQFPSRLYLWEVLIATLVFVICVVTSSMTLVTVSTFIWTKQNQKNPTPQFEDSQAERSTSNAKYWTTSRSLRSGGRALHVQSRWALN